MTIRTLRSCNAVVGYHLHATDGEIGHVAGMLVDETTWAIHQVGHAARRAIGSPRTPVST